MIFVQEKPPIKAGGRFPGAVKALGEASGIWWEACPKTVSKEKACLDGLRCTMYIAKECTDSLLIGKCHN